MGLVLNFIVSEEVGLSGEDSYLTTTALLADDQLPIEDTAEITNAGIFLIEDGIAVVDSILNLSANVISTDLIADSLVNADQSSFNQSMPFIVEESFVIDVVGDIGGIFSPIITETLAVLAGILLDEYPYLIISLDTEKLLPAIHSMPFFNSFIEFDGEIYGLNENGLFKFTGDDDDGQTIHTGVVWNKTNFGFPHNKRIKTAIVDGLIDKSVMQAKTASGSAFCVLRKNRIPVGRKLYGRDWEIRLSEFERLESFEIIPVLLRK